MATPANDPASNSDPAASPQPARNDLQQIHELQESVKEQFIRFSNLSEQTMQEMREQQDRFHVQFLQACESLRSELRNVFEPISTQLLEQNKTETHQCARYNSSGNVKTLREVQEVEVRESTGTTMFKAVVQIAAIVFGIFAVLSWTAARTANSDAYTANLHAETANSIARNANANAQTANLLAMGSFCLGVDTQHKNVSASVHQLCRSFLSEAGPRLKAAASSIVPPTSSSTSTGFPVGGGSGGTAVNDIAVGVGLGVSIPIVVVLAGTCYLHRRKARAEQIALVEPPP